ncbi:hypothetical protein DWUX_1636 [Desulfovibrio diazotrophicus]|nr:hypothetical protein DWUX_1636 [Desulfovibrio diazotrophicus]
MKLRKGQEKGNLCFSMNSPNAKNPRPFFNDRGFLNYLVELDRIELTAS